MDVEDYEYRMLYSWVEQGMPYGKETDPVVAKIECLPKGRIMDRGADQQITVLASYSDGTTEDVTRTAQFEPNDPEMAETTFTGLVKTLDLTGDVAIMDDDGFFYIVDRIKDLILCSGYNVYPRQIEEAIYQHPDVEEVIVIGIDDAKRFTASWPDDAQRLAELSEVHGPSFEASKQLVRKELPGWLLQRARAKQLDLAPDGAIVQRTKPDELGRAVKPETAQAVAAMMASGEPGAVGSWIVGRCRLQRCGHLHRHERRRGARCGPEHRRARVGAVGAAEGREVPALEKVDSQRAVAGCLARGRALGRSVLMQGDDAQANGQEPMARPLARSSRLRVPLDLPHWLLNPFTIRAFNEVYYRAQPRRARVRLPSGVGRDPLSRRPSPSADGK